MIPRKWILTWGGILLCSMAMASGVKVGAERFGEYVGLLSGKRVGIVANQTSRVRTRRRGSGNGTLWIS